MAKVHANTKKNDIIKKKYHTDFKIKNKEKPCFIPALQILASFKECCDGSTILVSVVFIQFDTETKEVQSVDFVNTGNTYLVNCI